MNPPSDLDKRRAESDPSVTELAEKLWGVGYLGCVIEPRRASDIDSLRGVLGDEARRVYRVENRTLNKWYFFEYNREGSIVELLNRYEQEAEATARLVLHPITFQSLLLRVDRETPIGA